MDFRKKKYKKKVEDFVNKLRHSDKIYDFACKINFLLIQKLLKLNIPKKDLLNNLQKKYIIVNNKKVCNEKGYELKQVKDLLKINKLKDFIKYHKNNKIKLLNITSAFYDYFYFRINIINLLSNNKFLQNKVLTKFNNLYCTNYKNFENLKNLIKNTDNKDILFDLFTFTDSFNLFSHSISVRRDYVHKSKYNISSNSKFKYKILKKNLINNDLLNNNLIRGNSYKITNVNLILNKLYKINNKYLLAGISGSSIFTYNTIFNYLNLLKKNKKNKILLLLFSISDYYGMYHSITEILQVYIPHSKLPRYTLEMNDLDYLKSLDDKLINSFL